MALITIGTTIVDVADVALVAPRGSVSQVYLADGSQLASALTAAAQATAVNATAAGDQLTTVVVSSNYGSCYISGPNTQRVDTDGAGTGTIWYLRGGPGPVVCAATNLAAAEALIDATVASSGGGVGGVWTPVITNGAGTTATLVGASPTYMYVGDAVLLTAVLSVTVAALGTGSFTLTGLPVPADPTTDAPILPNIRISGDATPQLIFANVSDVDTITFTQVAAGTLETVVQMILHVTYRPA